jgi:hypothetical protein
MQTRKINKRGKKSKKVMRGGAGIMPVEGLYSMPKTQNDMDMESLSEYLSNTSSKGVHKGKLRAQILLDSIEDVLPQILPQIFQADKVQIMKRVKINDLLRLAIEIIDTHAPKVEQRPLYTAVNHTKTRKTQLTREEHPLPPPPLPPRRTHPKPPTPPPSEEEDEPLPPIPNTVMIRSTNSMV